MTYPDPAWLDSQYNNRLLVEDFPGHLTRWAQWSATALATSGASLDLSYGAAASERLDVYPAQSSQPGLAGRGAPVLVFLHGGYWRSLDKKDFAFIGPAFAQTGACVVIPNYALCPGTAGNPVTIPDITLQTVRALAWVWRHIASHGGDPSRITVVGHSAGGHLAAMVMACRWKALGTDLPGRLVKNALAISGLYELETLRHSPYLQTDLKLTAADALRASPAWLPAPAVQAGRGEVYAVCGGKESAEFLRHNALIQQAWGKAVVPVCEPQPGLNHFSILEALIDPAHRMNQLARELLRQP